MGISAKVTHMRHFCIFRTCPGCSGQVLIFQPSMANNCWLSRARGGGDAGSQTPPYQWLRPEFVPRAWTMLGSSGNIGQVVRRPGPHQGTSVHVHIDMNVDPVLPQTNPSVFTEAVNLWSRVASLLTPWCAKGRCLRESSEPEPVLRERIMYPMASR